MPLADVDPELLIDAVLMHVDDLGAGMGTDWLRGEFDRVLGEVLAGAVFCRLTGFEGASSQFDQGLPAQALLAILTQCRKRLNLNSDGFSDNPAQGAMLVPRFRDFPLGYEYPVGPYPNDVGIPTNYY